MRRVVLRNSTVMGLYGSLRKQKCDKPLDEHSFAEEPMIESVLNMLRKESLIKAESCHWPTQGAVVMKVAMMKTYRQNRERFPASDLKRYDGQWVAFSADGCRIVASGASIGQVSELVGAAHEDIQEVVLERIEIETADIQVGGAELF